MRHNTKPTLQQPLNGNETSSIDLESAIGWEPDMKPEYRKALDDWKKKNPLWDFNGSALTCESANEIFTANYNDVPSERLFGDLIRTGELTIMFADTGVGKSLLAVQIADAVARGIDVITDDGTRAPLPTPPDGTRAPLPALLPNESTAPQKVLYVDFEMSRAQTAERYSEGFESGEYHGRYRFPELLERAFPDFEDGIPDGFKNYTEFAAYSLEKEVEFKRPRLVIIDNISWLTQGQSVRESLRLMKTLKSIKYEHKLGLLVLAHTPKRPTPRYLSVNDLAGSKSIANFADNIFAIGRSKRAEDLRYIKQIKQRNGPVHHGEDNIIVCRLEKLTNFPRFELVTTAQERYHTLRVLDDPGYDRTKLIEQCRELQKINWPQRQIADHLNISLTTVNRYLSESGQNREL